MADEKYVKIEYVPNYNLIYPGTTIVACNNEKKDNKMYLSGDFNLNGQKIYIREVLYNNPATIVFWNDGSKTICKCSNGDVYSKETGLAICILKKLVGGVKVHDVFEDWIIEDTDRVTIKEVRHNSKC